MEKIILGIDGMSCGMCESHVNDTVRKAFNVKSVKSSHRKNQTVIVAEDGTVDEEALKNAINATGYKVVSFERGAK